MSNYQTVLLDLDGTLVDSSPGVIHSLQQALSSFGLTETAAHLKTLIGPPIATILLQLYPQVFVNPDHLKRAIHCQRVYYATIGVHESIVYPDVVTVLSALAEAGKPLFVATSKATQAAKHLLKFHHLAPYFIDIIGSPVTLNGANKSAIISHLLKKYPDYALDTMCMVGDRHHDINTATALGIASIGVTYGYGSASEIALANPTHTIANFKDLLELLA